MLRLDAVHSVDALARIKETKETRKGLEELAKEIKNLADLLTGTETRALEQVKTCNASKEQVDQSFGEAEAPELSAYMRGFVEYVQHAPPFRRPNGSDVDGSTNSMLKLTASPRGSCNPYAYGAIVSLEQQESHASPAFFASGGHEVLVEL